MKLRINEDYPDNNTNEAYSKIKANTKYLNKLKQSVSDIKSGNYVVKTIEELEEMENE